MRLKNFCKVTKCISTTSNSIYQLYYCPGDYILNYYSLLVYQEVLGALYSTPAKPGTVDVV